MKRKTLRIISVVLTGCIFALLCGCTNPFASSKGGAPSGVDKLYTADCEITVGGGADEEELFYAGKLCRLGGGFWELSLSEPETVKGLKICLGAEGINASLGDLNFELETDKIPSRAAFMKVFSCLDDAAANINSLAMSENETNLCYQGGSGDKRYTILCNKTDNFPCGINIGNITVVFLSFTVNGTAPETGTGTVTVTETASGTSETSSVTTVSETTTVTTTPAETTTVSATTSPTMTSPLFTVSSSTESTTASE